MRTGGCAAKMRDRTAGPAGRDVVAQPVPPPPSGIRVASRAKPAAYRRMSTHVDFPASFCETSNRGHIAMVRCNCSRHYSPCVLPEPAVEKHTGAHFKPTLRGGFSHPPVGPVHVASGHRAPLPAAGLGWIASSPSAATGVGPDVRSFLPAAVKLRPHRQLGMGTCSRQARSTWLLAATPGAGARAPYLHKSRADISSGWAPRWKRGWGK